MLIDKVEISVVAGHGGAGKVSFGPMRFSGPDGGNGGRGGDIYVRAVNDITLLNQFSQKKLIEAENGVPGQKAKMAGKNAEDLYINLPVGTEIINKETGEIMLELTQEGQIERIAKGGIGGRGNWEFRSPRLTTPKFAQKGMPGEKFDLILSLKLIADFGLIGLPNAGKSSLLNELTNANAKIGNYEFTTLSPNLGVFEGKIIADIPGLIEGASTGKGLGIGFLKHIEKVKMLIHCISSESSNIEADYKTIREELKNYNPELLKKEELIVLTKSDLADKIAFKNAIAVSIHDYDSINKLKSKLK